MVEALIKTRKFNKEKFEQILNKCILVIEFIISIILLYLIYQIVIYKNYQNIWHLKYILCSLFMGTIVVGCIIWNCKKSKFEKIIISFLIPIGMAYVFFIAPGYVPDEQAHIWKALEISEGKLMTEITEDGESKESIPHFFENHIIPYIKTYGHFNNVSKEKTDYNDLFEVQNPAQAYPAVLYIASSIAFFIGKILGLNGIFAIYLAKIFNFIIFLILGYFSIKCIPFGKWIVAIILFLPMSLQQAVSVSADSFLNAVSILFICYTMYLCKNTDEINIKDKIIYIVMGIIIAISKVVYISIIGISLLIIGNKKIKNKEKGIFLSTLIILSVISGIIWFLIIQSYPVAESNLTYNETYNINLKEQVMNIIKNPMIFVTVLNNTFKGGFYVEGIVGSLMGWLNIEISRLVTLGFIILLALAPFLDENKVTLNIKQKIWNIIIFLGTYTLIILAAYVSWTTVNSDKVMGVQGRYFLPIIVLPLICLCDKERYIKFKNIKYILPTVCVGLNIIAIVDIAKFFL